MRCELVWLATAPFFAVALFFVRLVDDFVLALDVVGELDGMFIFEWSMPLMS